MIFYPHKDYDIEVRYFGKDAEDFLESINHHTDIGCLGKECTTRDGKKGVIVGIEDNHYISDYYFIIYVPETGKTVYEITNNTNFFKTIEI